MFLRGTDSLGQKGQGNDEMTRIKMHAGLPQDLQKCIKPKIYEQFFS